jgi:hypothetical protein
MSEIEPPTEHLHEHLHHAAEHGKEAWISWVALSSALLAVLAAVCASLAGQHVDEAMITRIQASDQWAYFQAKAVKAAVLGSKMEMLGALGRTPAHEDGEKLQRYEDERKDISEKAEKLERESEAHLRKHVILANGVTLFQVAIAVGAIAALSRQRNFWYVSLVFGALAAVSFARGLLAV